MSGRDLVQEMRDSGKAPRAPSAGLGAFEWVVGFVIVVAIGAIGYFGMTQWLSPGTPRPGATPPTLIAAAQAGVPVAIAWTDKDSAVCLSRAQAAVDAPLPGEMGLANRAVTEGFAGLATRLHCHLTTKIKRFCDPAQKAAAIAMVNDYLSRSDLVRLGLGVEGAPMALLGGLWGGEVAAGSDVYDEQRTETLQFMASYDKRVSAALQALARGGLMAPSDFSGLMGGVPKNIDALFGTVQRQENACA